MCMDAMNVMHGWLGVNRDRYASTRLDCVVSSTPLTPDDVPSHHAQHVPVFDPT